MVAHWNQPRLVLFMFISGLAPSAYAMSNRPHGGHEGRPLHITAQPRKRDATICPTSYSLCPASVSGGCCPTDLSCGVSSCYPTTAVPAQCSGSPGYIACGIDEGGGCCQSGFTCDIHGCIPPAGSTYSQDCGTSSYMCPTSLGVYACCHNDLACGVGYCYSTSFSSVPVTVTYTTTISNSITQTITTVIQTAYTQSIPQGLATTAAASSIVTKFTPPATAVAKTQASSDSSNALTQAELGGIIGAAVLVVLVVCIATFLIIRRLNAVARVAKAAAASRKSGKSGLSGYNTQSSTRPRPHGPAPSAGYSGIGNIEAMSIDPLIMSDSDTNVAHSSLGLPRPSAVYSTRSDLEPGASPPIPAPYGSPQAYIGGYQQVPMSDPSPSDRGGHQRSQSSDSAGNSRSPRSRNITGYFDIDPAMRDQNLRHGHVPSRQSIQSHGRQWSDTSDASQHSGGSQIIELDAGPDGDRRSSLQRAVQGVGFSRVSGRRVSVDGQGGSAISGAMARRDVSAVPGTSQRLENVQEAEFDTRERSVTGPAFTAAEVPRTPRTPRTAYQSQFHEMGISAMGPSGLELERLEEQKVMGNLGDIRRGLK